MVRKPHRLNRRMDDDWYEEPFFFMGIGSLHDLSSDPRNPRLAGLKSVSYNASVALRRPEPSRPAIGFHRPKR